VILVLVDDCGMPAEQTRNSEMDTKQWIGRLYNQNDQLS